MSVHLSSWRKETHATNFCEQDSNLLARSVKWCNKARDDSLKKASLMFAPLTACRHFWSQRESIFSKVASTQTDESSRLLKAVWLEIWLWTKWFLFMCRINFLAGAIIGQFLVSNAHAYKLRVNILSIVSIVDKDPRDGKYWLKYVHFFRYLKQKVRSAVHCLVTFQRFQWV